MDFFKKRPAAIAITAVIICAAVFLGFWNSAGRAAKKVENEFYSGTYNSEEKYTEPGISSHLNNCVDYSLGLISAVSDYDGLSPYAGALRTSRSALIDAIDSGDIHGMYQANEALKSDFDALIAQAGSAALDSGDAEAVEYYSSSFSGAESSIASSGYNDAVTSFTVNVLGVFPANALNSLVGVDPPEYFA